ncbi:hypothetical protein Ataiwa_15170 [Algoriphagus taiwanensis]|uniref:Uncharacterized protein n=1 Tax=Algoriphagus taiwanensis TaxID=1445656 RepID=A0ABQ6PZ79_9BACT|nr:hypothetical protein Ataiwa_15170 [Algoriphagus taiwanensis]
MALIQIEENKRELKTIEQLSLECFPFTILLE